MRSHLSVDGPTTKFFSNSFVFKNGIEKEGLPGDITPALGAGGPTDELITSDCPLSKQAKSILSRARWSPDAEPFHLVKQRSAFQSKAGGHAARPPQLPVCALTLS
jgi:hypothetical protein